MTTCDDHQEPAQIIDFEAIGLDPSLVFPGRRAEADGPENFICYIKRNRSPQGVLW